MAAELISRWRPYVSYDWNNEGFSVRKATDAGLSHEGSPNRTSHTRPMARLTPLSRRPKSLGKHVLGGSICEIDCLAFSLVR